MDFKKASLTAFTSLFIMSATAPSQAINVGGVGFSGGGSANIGGVGINLGGGSSIGGGIGGVSFGFGGASDVVDHSIRNGKSLYEPLVSINSSKCKAMRNLSARFQGEKITSSIKKKFLAAGGGKTNVKVWNIDEAYFQGEPGSSRANAKIMRLVVGKVYVLVGNGHGLQEIVCMEKIKKTPNKNSKNNKKDNKGNKNNKKKKGR